MMDRRAFLTRLTALGLVVPAVELVQRSYFFGPWLPPRPVVVPFTRADLEAEKLRFDTEYTRFVAWLRDELMITHTDALRMLATGAYPIGK